MFCVCCSCKCAVLVPIKFVCLHYACCWSELNSTWFAVSFSYLCVCVCVSCFLFVVCAFFLFGLLCCCSNRHTEKKVAINWSRQIKPWVSSFANVCIRSNSTFRPCIVGNVFWLHTIRAYNIYTHFFASLNIVQFVLLLCAQKHTITCACAFAVLLIYSTLVLMVWH